MDFIISNSAFKFVFFSPALKGNDGVLLKRARHVITEIQRTQEAAKALERCDFKKVCITKRQIHTWKNKENFVLLTVTLRKASVESIYNNFLAAGIRFQTLSIEFV